MPQTKIHVAIIDNSLDPEVYNPVLHWSRWLSVGWEAYRALEGRLPELGGGGFTHIILTGSEASILDRETWVDREVELVRRALEDRVPILGSCYGHQLLALAAGGPDCVRRSPEPEIGWLPIRVQEETPLLGPPGTVHAFTLHFDEVVARGQGFKVLASTPGCPVQAFQFGDGPAWGIQSHPEIGVEDGRMVLEAELKGGYKGSEAISRALASVPLDSGLIHSIVPAFMASGSRLSFPLTKP
jgi:GMP synthase-like glutamine amidotransferase